MRSLINVPNALTLLRIGFVPILGVAIFQNWNVWLTLAIFLVAAITDLLDGWYARKHQLVTSFGKLADPIADKALTGIAWIGLTWFGVIPAFATILVLIREIGITVVRLLLANRIVQAADKGGKLKTTLQITVISLLIVTPTDFPSFIWWPLNALLAVTVVVTVWTGWNYLVQIRRGLKNAN